MAQTTLDICACYVGLFMSEDHTEIMTLEEIMDLIEKRYKFRKTNPYFDEEREFMHFNFCPKCGKKIDWEVIKLT